MNRFSNILLAGGTTVFTTLALVALLSLGAYLIGYINNYPINIDGLIFLIIMFIPTVLGSLFISYKLFIFISKKLNKANFAVSRSRADFFISIIGIVVVVVALNFIL